MRVAVVGLGMAGLRAAQLLESSGVEVVPIEARDRVGGRLRTVRAGKGWYEAGGEWIDADHCRTLRLLRGFGLEPEPADPRPRRFVCGGETRLTGEIWEDAAKDAERVRTEAARISQGLKTPPWCNEAGLDERAVSAFLDSLCATARGRWLTEAVLRSDEGTDSDRVGLLGWLVNVRMYADRNADNSEMSAFRFPIGAERVCGLMVQSLAAKPLLNRPLTGVQQGDSHVELWLKDEVVFADRAVLTVPPKPLLRIDFEPELPKETRSAYERLGSAPCVKVALRFKSRFWDGASWLTDLPVQQVWDGGRDGEPLLLCYVCGREAERLSQSAATAVGRTLESVSDLFPQAKEEFVEGAFHDWISDPWSLGGFASLGPGSVRACLPHVGRPHRRVHFAGEATAEWMGFVEGALESAERVVQEVLHEEKIHQRS
jgi:monoamine oxidase